MSRLKQTFKELKGKGRIGLIPYITVGFPNFSVTRDLIKTFDDLGVTAVELGVPFSDPLADGPVIQDASQKALLKHANLQKTLSLVHQLRHQVSLPIIIMTYFNIFLRYGLKRVGRDLRNAGVDGIIIPDFFPEDDQAFMKSCRSKNIDQILIISGTTVKKRLESLVKQSRGFVYYATHTGTTGPRDRLPKDVSRNVKKIRSCTDKPIAVGFGISNRGHIRELSECADAAIVGSAVIRVMNSAKTPASVARNVKRFIKGIWS